MFDYLEDVDMLIYIPSISLGSLTRKHLSGIKYFQERNYYLAAFAKDRNKEVVLLVSNDMNDTLFFYHLKQLSIACELSEQNLRKRVHLIRVSTKPEETLGSALLENETVLEKIKELTSSKRCILDFWTVGEKECLLAAKLNLPYLGMPKEVIYNDTKEESKRIFQNANVKTPKSFGVFYDLESMYEDIVTKKIDYTGKLLLKLNGEDGGNGIASINLSLSPESIEDLRYKIKIDKATISFSEFEQQISIQGFILETFLEYDVFSSPSVKMYLHNNGFIELLATHEQNLHSTMFLGVEFPCKCVYAKEVTGDALRVGHECYKNGWRGLVSIDFIVTKEKDEITVWAIEINSRKTATTHPYYWTIMLTKAEYNSIENTLVENNCNVVYKSFEYVSHKIFDFLNESEIIEFIASNNLAYDLLP